MAEQKQNGQDFSKAGERGFTEGQPAYKAVDGAGNDLIALALITCGIIMRNGTAKRAELVAEDAKRYLEELKKV